MCYTWLNKEKKTKFHFTEYYYVLVEAILRKLMNRQIKQQNDLLQSY